MKRALVLNAGSSWAAYQIGALRHLITERAMTFDLYAGTGTGAMNAALVACGEFPALEAFWQRIGLRQLVTPNFRTPWSEGPFRGTPQRRFVAAHVSESKLRSRGVKLLISTLDLQSGRERVLAYPGCDLPLVDGIMAAVATPGLIPPMPHRGRQLVEGTLVSSFLLHRVLEHPVEEIVAVAAAICPGREQSRRYATWRAVLERALAMNQAHDVWEALEDAEKITSAAVAFRHVSENVPQRLTQRVPDPMLRQRLETRLSEIYDKSEFPLQRASGPSVRSITPSRDLTYPLWRFSHRALTAANDLG